MIEAPSTSDFSMDAPNQSPVACGFARMCARPLCCIRISLSDPGIYLSQIKDDLTAFVDRLHAVFSGCCA